MILSTELLLLLLLALAAGVIIGILGDRLWLRSRFRVAVGEIESSRMDTSLRSRAGHRLYGVRVRYSYNIDGKVYTGTAIAPGYRYSTEEVPQRALLNRYPKGKQVAVYYNPTNPEEAYLEYGLPRFLIAILVLALIFLLVVIVVLLREITKLEGVS